GVELGVIRIVGPQLTFAGARFALNRFADGQIEEIKGDRSGIGYRKISMSQTFTNHEVITAPGDQFYIWTDGITDQIGGVKRRSFGKRRVRGCISDFQPMSLPRQKVHILRDFIEYQHNEERRDDITFFGFKLPE
ncbi:MAG: SpoIIE family protein phosphatase, partial [Rhodospirillaceae bacterium]|nr:SpoIIE family protein phosphatase [Rhodospirillaceae bacterium]